MQRVRETGRDAMAALFTEVDLVVTPTAAGAVPAVADLPVRRTIDALYTPAWNATGNPALSVPMGFTCAGLPLGLQIIGRHHQETAVLDAGHAFQLRTDWHLRAPTPASAAEPGPELVPDRVREAAPDSAVLALLDVAGLAPTTADVHALAARHTDLFARIDALYRVPPVTTSELPR